MKKKSNISQKGKKYNVYNNMLYALISCENVSREKQLNFS